LKQTRTEKRISKIRAVVSKRQPSLKIILENIHDPHNVSAIFRTCDAAGIPKVSLLYNIETFPKIGKKSSASAFKWIEKEKFKSVEECYKQLRAQGYKIYASSISEGAQDLYKIDFTEKSAIVMGNEHRGVSKEAEDLADKKFYIPMYGMVQSLNVSVSAAITIYEALRQRTAKSMYDKNELNDEEIEEWINKWSKK
jgi:tRNA (guanosine-2'-O-)-methyltransferase